MAVSVRTLIPTPVGWYEAGELQKGTIVFDRWGTAQTVLSTHLYTPTKMYRLWYADGTYLECDPNQRIEFIPEAQRHNATKIEANRQRSKRSDTLIRFKTVEEFFNKGLKDKRGRLNFSTKTTEPVNFYTEDFPVPPFIVGWWYSNRNTNQARLNIRAKIKDHFIATLNKLRWQVIKKKNGSIAIPQSIGTTMLIRYPTIPTIMPHDYMFGSIDQRIELLQGIMVNYTDSYKTSQDLFFIETKNHKFARVIQGVLESLGVRVLYSECGSDTQLKFRTELPLLPWQKKTKPHTSYRYRLIAEIHEIESKPCIHIETEKPMLVTASYISSWH